MNVTNVERYQRQDQMRNPIVHNVEDLKPGSFYDQKIAEDDPSGKIFSLTTFTTGPKQGKVSRLVFRTGTFKVGKLNEYVVLKLSGFDDCLYIVSLQDSFEAQTFFDYVSGTGANETLDITPDVRLYLERKLLANFSRHQSRLQSTSQPNQDDSQRKHPIYDGNSSRNVRTRLDDDRL